MKTLKVIPDNCVGCLNCIYACLSAKQKESVNAQSMIRICVSYGHRLTSPLYCRHCKDPDCLHVCPATAISRDPITGAVIIDGSRCIGCKMCILNCPYGSIVYDMKGKKSKKCNLCNGKPSCVEHCIAGALNYEEE